MIDVPNPHKRGGEERLERKSTSQPSPQVPGSAKTVPFMRTAPKTQQQINEHARRLKEPTPLRDALIQIAEMPEIDQDDAHRLRHMARLALKHNPPSVEAAQEASIDNCRNYARLHSDLWPRSCSTCGISSQCKFNVPPAEQNQ